MPSVVGSTSPSIEWLESIREIKNRHYKPSKSYTTIFKANKLQILQNQCQWIENFKTKLLQKDSYFSDCFWERYGLPKFDLKSAIPKTEKIKENGLEMFKSLTAWAHWSAAHSAEQVRVKEKKERKTEGRSGSPARRTHRRRLLVAIATEGRGRGSREARGGEAQLVGVVAGAGEVGSGDGVVNRGGRRWSRMPTRTPATNHSGEGVIGFLGFWIGGEDEELVAGWFWRGKSTRGRAAMVSSSPALWCSLGAATGWGGVSGLEEGGEVLSGCRGALI